MAEIVCILEERALVSSFVIWRMIPQIQANLCVSQHQWQSFEFLKFAVLEVHADTEGLRIQSRNQACSSSESFHKSLRSLSTKPLMFLHCSIITVPSHSLSHSYEAKPEVCSRVCSLFLTIWISIIPHNEGRKKLYTDNLYYFTTDKEKRSLYCRFKKTPEKFSLQVTMKNPCFICLCCALNSASFQ